MHGKYYKIAWFWTVAKHKNWISREKKEVGRLFGKWVRPWCANRMFRGNAYTAQNYATCNKQAKRLYSQIRRLWYVFFFGFFNYLLSANWVSLELNCLTIMRWAPSSPSLKTIEHSASWQWIFRIVCTILRYELFMLFALKIVNNLFVNS